MAMVETYRPADASNSRDVNTANSRDVNTASAFFRSNASKNDANSRKQNVPVDRCAGVGEHQEISTSRCNVERVALVAKDGHTITGIRYWCAGPFRANLIVAGGIGVPQRFYRRFAKFAAARGYQTLTIDYRGIGLSAPPTLRNVAINCLDWARLDLAAAVECMSDDRLPLYMIGHSFGGQAFGLLPNHKKVAKLVTFGTGAGWHGWMPPLERVKVLAMWHIVAPILTSWKGYWPWSALRMGEDLPMGVYRQWKQWCRYRNYYLGDPAMQPLISNLTRVRTPIIAANSIDDRWAPPESRNAFMAGYKNSAIEYFDIDPGQCGLKNIGHMGYFRVTASPLWEQAIAWLEEPEPHLVLPSTIDSKLSVYH